MSRGIRSWGAYVPKRRIARSAIAAAHAWMAPSLRSLAKGERAYCNWDEDSVTMAVEAARVCLGAADRSSVDRLSFATTTAPFADLSASAIAAVALRLEPATGIYDFGGSQRTGVASLVSAFSADAGVTLVTAADQLLAKPASVQEMQYGAGAAAFLVGDGPVAAECIGMASKVALFVDHFRAAAADHDYYWEERWIRDEGYLKLGAGAVSDALAKAGVDVANVSRFIFAAPGKAIAQAVAKAVGISDAAVADPLDAHCGYAGAAHGPLMLADALDKAGAREIIVVAGFGQGCEVVVLRTTDAIATMRSATSVAATIDAGIVDDAYLRLASFSGEIALDWGMRAERDTKTALTEQYRSADQVYGFVAGTCGSCGTTQFPQLAYCVECRAPASGFSSLSLADAGARVLTYTADSLMYHPSPPLYIGFAQFDNGARLLMEFVDVEPAAFDVGTRLTMRFRIKERDETRGYNRYFWKAAPAG